MAEVDRAQVFDALSTFIREEVLLSDDAIPSDRDLFDIGFDSMSLSRVLVFVEERFGVVIPDQEVVVDEVTTLDKMTDFVKGWLDRRGA